MRKAEQDRRDHRVEQTGKQSFHGVNHAS